MKLIIEDDGGRRTVVPLFREELIIGRAEGSPVRLTEKDVSRRHARICRRSGRVYVEDLGSFTGVRVNGDRIRGSRLVREGDLIEISQYDLTLQAGPDEKPEPDPLAAEETSAPIHGARRGVDARKARITTFVVALLVASALAAAFWLRTARGAEAQRAATASTTSSTSSSTNTTIDHLDRDTRWSRDSAPPESRDSRTGNPYTTIR
ncbi:MAG TPA: FHA domain-containing protein [Myxococcales bacterium]|nr:FHA domain-containing protein [Myxococcales bacterium]